MKKLLSITLLICIISSLVACSSNKYDVSASEVKDYLWSNCFKEVIDGKAMDVSVSLEKPYIWFRCYLPNNRNKKEVEPILETLRQSVIEKCSGVSFEPYNSFLHDSYYTVYVEFINPDFRFSDYPRSAGILKIDTEFFPIENEHQEKAIYYY